MGAILDIYISAEDDVYWTDPAIASNFGKFKKDLKEFDRLMDDFKSAARNAYGSDLRRLRKIDRPASSSSCPAWKSSRVALRKGRAAFGRMSDNFVSISRIRSYLRNELDYIDYLIDGGAPITEGHVDGAVYDFGSEEVLYPPQGEQRAVFDPEVFNVSTDIFLAYSASTDAVFMNGFNRQMEKAVSSARKASRTCPGR